MNDPGLVQMFGVRELPSFYRTNFSIPGNPYKDDKLALNYLQELGIIFFRDEEHSQGVLIDSPGLNVLEDSGYEAFRFSGKFDKNFEIMEWPIPLENDRMGRRKREDYVKKKGDASHWLRWNESGIINHMDELNVVFV